MDIEFNWHKKQLKCFSFTVRYLIAVCGRFFGKTRGAIMWGIGELFRSNGDVGWFVSLTYRQSKIAMRYLLKIAKETPGLSNLIESTNFTELIVTFRGGKRIEFRSAERPNNLVGENTLAFLIMDEAGLMSDDVWTLIRPNLASYQCRVIFIGTPRGFNWYYNLYMNALNNGLEYRVETYTSYDNPLIPKEEIDAVYNELMRVRGKEWADQEIYAKFNAQTLAVFQGPDKCLVDSIGPLTPAKRYWMGIDVAFKNDDVAIVIVERSQYEVAHIQVFNRAVWDHVCKTIFDLWKRYNKPLVYIDTTRESFAAENLEATYMEHGFFVNQVHISVKVKNDLVSKAVHFVGKKILRIPSTEMGFYMVNQMNTFEMQERGSGYIRTRAKGKNKDDIVMALCLALFDAPMPREEKKTDDFQDELRGRKRERYLMRGY